MRRRFIKTMTWSLLAFSVTTLIGWALTGDPIKGGMIGLLCRAIKIPAYWWHDGMYAKHWPAGEPTAVVDDVPAEWRATEYHAHANEVAARAAREHCNAG
jgi:uncharacterized membrane protein